MYEHINLNSLQTKQILTVFQSSAVIITNVVSSFITEAFPTTTLKSVGSHSYETPSLSLRKLQMT